MIALGRYGEVDEIAGAVAFRAAFRSRCSSSLDW